MNFFNTNGPLYSQGYEPNSFFGTAIPNAFRSEHASNDIDAPHFPMPQCLINSPCLNGSRSQRSGITGGRSHSHQNQDSTGFGGSAGSTGSGFGFHVPSSQESTTTCSSSSVYQLPSTNGGRREEWTERETNSLFVDIDRPWNGHDVVNVNLDGSLSSHTKTSTLDVRSQNILPTMNRRAENSHIRRMGIDALLALPACSSESRSPCSRRTRSGSRSRSRNRNRAFSGMRLDERSGLLTLNEQEEALWDPLDLKDSCHYVRHPPFIPGRNNSYNNIQHPSAAELLLQLHSGRGRSTNTLAADRVPLHENVIRSSSPVNRAAVSHHSTSLHNAGRQHLGDIQRLRRRETLLQIRMQKKRSSSLPSLRDVYKRETNV